MARSEQLENAGKLRETSERCDVLVSSEHTHLTRQTNLERPQKLYIIYVKGVREGGERLAGL